MKRWDVVLLRFPFSDHSATKVRPAVIISPSDYNSHGDDILVMLITSNTTRQSKYDIIVPRTHPEFQQTGLHKESAIRVSKMTTLAKIVIRGQLGILGPNLVAQVEHELRSFLELPPAQTSLPGVP